MEKLLSKKYRLLNNIKAVASYDPISRIICFEEIESTEFDEIKANAFDEKNLDKFLTIIHEMRHSLDMHSTIAGAKFNNCTLDLIEVITEGMDESKLWKLKKFDNVIRKFSVEKYYHMIHMEKFTTKDNENWTMNITVGSRFDSTGQINHSDPIIMVNFSYKEAKVARVPLTLMSLLEVNAVATELLIHQAYIESLEDSKAVELELLKRRFLKFIYNSELLEYSVAAQVTALLLGNSNIVLMYTIAEYFSRISLNMPKVLYEKIRIPDSFKEIVTSQNRHNGFIENCDPTYIFLCLIGNLIESKIEYSTHFNMDALLEYSNLPDLKTVELLIKRELIDLNRTKYNSSIIKPVEIRTVEALSFFEFQKPTLGLDELVIKLTQFGNYRMLFCDQLFDEDNLVLQQSNFFWNLDSIKSEFITACF